MSGVEIIFIIVAIVTLLAALFVVTTPNLVHAALWLILALFGVAATFVLLNATFLAVVQVVVYIGAIAVLMIFAIMLTRRVMEDSGPQINSNWILAALLGLVLFVGLTFVLINSGAANASLSDLVVDPVEQLGKELVSPNAYVIPFELASVLLLAAMIGSIVIAWKK
ncbi:MAG: NADH-quinone oxidoreductase subunit J [Anaerolineales bacterium]|nr:NADH-quinone oxidoreductase subunit J [Chloroflexota bacterium]MBL6983796.1 NADH-quinone oxidoreductase subunit J [Anaerolineales bacterium]